MNIVAFPGLNLEFKINKVAFNLFGIDIYAYAICIVLGIIIALFLCKKSKDNYYIKWENVVDIMIPSIILGIIGARLYYVIFNIEYYLARPLQILNLRDGGLAIYGGLITGIVCVFNLCQKYKISSLDFLDYIVPFVAIAQSIGRWGNFFNVEAYGYQTTSLLRMRIFDLNGFQDVHPVFLYESIANLIIFIILRNLQSKRKVEGQIFLGYVMLYSGMRMFLENLRTDSLMFFGVRISGVLSIVVFLCSACFLMKKIIKNRIKESN